MLGLYCWARSRLYSLRSERGNAAEYGLIIALVSIMIIVGAGLLGTALNAAFNYVAGVVGTATP